MKQVQQGSLTIRIEPTGTDEIDVLTRQFNLMVEQLDRNDHVIRDLNANLDQKVTQRTQELLESEKTLQESLQKLQKYDQLKTDFFSNVSHELRTPLTSINGALRLLASGAAGQLPVKADEMAQLALRNGDRLHLLISDLLPSETADFLLAQHLGQVAYIRGIQRGLGGGERATGNLCSPGTIVDIGGTLADAHCINSTSKPYQVLKPLSYSVSSRFVKSIL